MTHTNSFGSIQAVEPEVIDLNGQLRPIDSNNMGPKLPPDPWIAVLVLLLTLGVVTIAVVDPVYRDDFMMFATTLIGGYAGVNVSKRGQV